MYVKEVTVENQVGLHARVICTNKMERRGNLPLFCFLFKEMP